MVTLRRGSKTRREKTKPEVVTGNFELHYEDVVSRNRLWITGIFATGLILLAVFVPSAVYHSAAGPDRVSIEVENGVVANPDKVTVVKGDATASDNGYIEFSTNPQINLDTCKDMKVQNLQAAVPNCPTE